MKSPSRSLRRRAAWTRVRMRIGALADLSPVWLEFPISMHRPLPDGGEIRWASPLQRITSRPPTVPGAAAAARQYRFIAAVSVLYSTLRHTFEREGGSAVRIKVNSATLTCHACRAVDAWNPAVTLSHTCSSCSLTWDQDYNAAINVLQSGLLTVKRPVHQSD
jgi:hypothetical protein